MLMFSKTFIRNAVGRALVDSPALNPHSRAVLVHLAQPQLPTTVRVAGPGPVEPTTEQQHSPEIPVPTPPATISKPAPELPKSTSSPTDDDEAGEAGDDGDDHTANHAKSNDPYANLGGAFGGYVTDEPRPMGAGRNGDIDDLLF